MIRNKIISGLIYIYLIILIVLPLFVVFLISIVPRWSSAFPSSFSLKWWVIVFSRPEFYRVILNTFWITIVSTIFTVGYGILASYLFVFYDFVGSKMLMLLILSPTYVSGVVIAFGLLNMYPMIRNTFWILMLGHFIIISPISFRYIYSSMIKVPMSIIEASHSLGSSKFNTFIKIILPLSRQGILAGTILSIGMNISELSVSLLLYGNKWVTIPIQIFSEIDRGILSIASVLSTILIVMTLSIVYLVSKIGENESTWKLR